jgi:peptidase E
VKRIVAMGGGSFLMEPRNPRLDLWLLSLARRRKRPRVLLLPTASGDSPNVVQRFYRGYGKHDCTPSHLLLFNRTVSDLRSVILAQDMIYVGGGNTANMLAIWRLHSVDQFLREAWENGTLLCGVSAGAICWFASGLTDSFGRPLQPLNDGLGFLPGSFCPHYDGESDRRPRYVHAVATSALPPGHAADDSVGLLFEDTTLTDVASSRRNKRAYRVDREGERELAVRYLGSRSVDPKLV